MHRSGKDVPDVRRIRTGMGRHVGCGQITPDSDIVDTARGHKPHFVSQQLFLPGFQLSFCVVLALALSASPLSSWLHRPFEIDAYIPRRRVAMWRRGTDDFLRIFAGLLAISIASWLGSKPPTRL